MTSSANDEWDYSKLTAALGLLEVEASRLEYLADNNIITNEESPDWTAKIFRHAMDFIEYNMREMEIKPSTNNGD